MIDFVNPASMTRKVSASLPATRAQALAIASYAMFWRGVPFAAAAWAVVAITHHPSNNSLAVNAALAVTALPFAAFVAAFPFVVVGAWQRPRRGKSEISTLPIAFVWYGLQFAFGMGRGHSRNAPASVAAPPG